MADPKTPYKQIGCPELSDDPVVLPHNEASVSLVPAPDLSAAFADVRSKLEAALSIPHEKWVPGRQVNIEIDLAIVPVRVRVIVDNK